MKKQRAPAGLRAHACRSRLRAGGAAALLMGTLLLTACDLPTSLPRLEPRFVLPVDDGSILVDELLPAGVTSTGTAFLLDLQPVTVQRTLGQMCGAPCFAVQGLVAPKPAFTHSFSTSHVLPADVSAAVLASGSIEVTARHSFDFDALRPQGALENGTLQIAVRSGGRLLGSATVDQPFPRTTTVSRTIALAAGEIAGPVEVQLTLASPAGGPVRIENGAALTVSVRPGVLQAEEVRTVLRSRTVAMQPLVVDLTGVEDELRFRARSGALVITIVNPFAVSGQLELRLHAPGSGVDYRRPVQVAPGTTTQRVALAAEELSWLLGFEVHVSVTGPLSSGATAVTLRPGQQVSLATRLELVLEIGG
jgi:hypothetical protein